MAAIFVRRRDARATEERAYRKFFARVKNLRTTKSAMEWRTGFGGALGGFGGHCQQQEYFESGFCEEPRLNAQTLRTWNE